MQRVNLSAHDFFCFVWLLSWFNSRDSWQISLFLQDHCHARKHPKLRNLNLAAKHFPGEGPDPHSFRRASSPELPPALIGQVRSLQLLCIWTLGIFWNFFGYSYSYSSPFLSLMFYFVSYGLSLSTICESLLQP